MTSLVLKFAQRTGVFGKVNQPNLVKIRRATTSPSGAILPEPKGPRFGVVGIVCVTAFGLCVGMTISKFGAHFLQETNLFVPADDDDDDDD